MNKIYLDNGSTSFPKAPNVGEAMKNYIENEGVNVSRGTYESAYSVAERVLDTRERLCSIFNFDKPENVIFTGSVTASLNMVLKGFLKSGDHVLCSGIEHNAVMRPLTQLLDCGVSFDRIPCDDKGVLQLDAMEGLLRENTRLVVMTHASNVCGTLTPAEEVGKFCREHGLRFVLDCAQTAGCVPIDMEKMNIDALCFTGHKSLLGPQGMGGFIIRDDFAAEIEPLVSGGTGSRSHLETVPEFMPDKFEAGTQNLPGILGLREALMFIEEKGIENIGRHELDMAMRLIEGVKDIPNVRLIGLPCREGRTAVVSLYFDSKDNAEAAWEIDSEFGIMTRCGLHCAPAAHKTLGTYPQGTVRFVPGWATTEQEIDTAIEAVRKAAHS